MGLQLRSSQLGRATATASLVLVIIAFGAILVLGTYGVLAHTYDEPAHIAAGIELIDRGTFTYEQQHPPLARLAVAFGPHLLGARSQAKPDIFEEGLAILYGTGDYTATLSAARLGVLPFFVALVAIASMWAYRDFGAVAALTTAFSAATTPPLLAQAGLATTDLPIAAHSCPLCSHFDAGLKNQTLDAVCWSASRRR